MGWQAFDSRDEESWFPSLETDGVDRIGFYFQFLCWKYLSGIMEIPGPEYNNVEFDAFRRIPWDFKTHVVNRRNHKVIVNDSEATANAIEEYGEVGLILAMGEATYNDEKRTFQRWHEELKGGKSKYEKERIKRRAQKRRWESKKG